LDLLLAEASQQPFSYSEQGATRGELPAGYRHDHWSADLCPDEAQRFDNATTALRSWVCQRSAGIVVQPDVPPKDGQTFVLLIRLRPVGWVTATARVVYTVEEPQRAGFAYGTLTGHPEQGEEAFIITRADGRVRFDITAFSRPRVTLARGASPITRALQLSATPRYLAGMRDATD